VAGVAIGLVHQYQRSVRWWPLAPGQQHLGRRWAASWPVTVGWRNPGIQVDGTLLWPMRPRLGERPFVLWSGLKGAVPILARRVHRPGWGDGRAVGLRDHLRGGGFSVIMQGGTVPAMSAAEDPVAHHRARAVEPWRAGSGRGT
jgi:hypothetical protein